MREKLRFGLVALTVASAVSVLGLVCQRARAVDAPRATQAEARTVLHDIQLTETLLRMVHVPEFPDDVPSAARPLLTRLKRDLRSLIQHDLNRRLNASPTQVLQGVLSQLRSVQAAMGGPCMVLGPFGPVFGKMSGAPSPCNSAPPETYGQISGLTLKIPPGHADLRVAVVSLNIMCGTDDSFYVWRRASTSWKLVLLNEVDGYGQIGAAHEGLRYAFAPTDPQGRWFMVLASNTPWCTSSWRAVRYQALRLGPSPDRPNVLLSREKEIWLGGNGYVRLRTRTDGFGISFWSEQGLDAGLLIRPRLENYRFVDGRLIRIPPLAATACGFLDSWLSMPWSKAARYYRGASDEPVSLVAGQPALGSVRAFHARFRKAQSSVNSLVYTNFGSLSHCDKGDEQVELDLSGSTSRPLQTGFPSRLYFLIESHNCDFRVIRVQTYPSGKCAVPARLPDWLGTLPEPEFCGEPGKVTEGTPNP